MNYFELGSQEKSKGNFTKALEYFDIAIDTEGNLGAYLLRSQIYQHLSRHKDALDDLNVIIKNKPDFATAYFGRGISYYVLGEEEENDDYIIRSAEEMHKAIRLDPNVKVHVLAFNQALMNRK